MPSFNSLVESLKQQLSQPLPGEAAQFLMAPEGRKEMVNVKGLMDNGRRSAVLLLLFPDGDSIKTVLIHRAEYDGNHSGQISLPGGKQEEGEELYTTAVRESSEEIGIDPARLEKLGALSPLYIPVSNFMVYPFVAALKEKPVFQIDTKEVQQLIEVNINDLNNCEKVWKELLVRQVYKIKAPCYELGTFTVWGATAMMLSEFLVILKALRTQNH